MAQLSCCTSANHYLPSHTFVGFPSQKNLVRGNPLSHGGLHLGTGMGIPKAHPLFNSRTGPPVEAFRACHVGNRSGHHPQRIAEAVRRRVARSTAKHPRRKPPSTKSSPPYPCCPRNLALGENVRVYLPPRPS